MRQGGAMSEATSSSVDMELVESFVTASRALVGIAVRSIETASPPVTVPQHRVLVLLAADGDLTVGEIAEMLGVNQSNASRVVDRLQRLELVERRRGSQDGRVVVVALTRKGRHVVESVMAQRRAEVAAVLSRVPPARARQMVAALAAFNAAANEPGESTWPDPLV
jgi:DNA-binding MarR family transcriptional regulator